MAGTAADARQTTRAARYPARSEELATFAATEARDAALATGTAAGTVVDAARTAVAVGITATAARVLRDEVRNSGVRAGAGSDDVG
ncbi:MAG: hypothetical protein QOG19_676 [Mycobacterium sp.]|nr:hypothetical protein [Mycobacterium sp.]